MLPITENIDDLILDFDEVEQENTKTFGIRELTTSSKNNITHFVGGLIDDIQALKQSIYFLLNIEADQYIIYPYTYGIQTLDLFGKPHDYVMAVIPERIRETLLSDDRITDISNFEFENENNKLLVKFRVHTVYDVDVEQEMVVRY